jgi:hypothetical protein
MKVVLMIIYLMGGEIVKLPVSLAVGQTCSDRFMELVRPLDVSVVYKNKIVLLYYCQKGGGEWVS